MAVAARTCEVEARGRADTFLQRLGGLAGAMTPRNGVRDDVRLVLGVIGDVAEREMPDGIENYRTKRRLGSGGRGTVFEVGDLELCRTVDLKISQATIDGASRHEGRVAHESVATYTTPGRGLVVEAMRALEAEMVSDTRQERRAGQGGRSQ